MPAVSIMSQLNQGRSHPSEMPPFHRFTPFVPKTSSVFPPLQDCGHFHRLPDGLPPVVTDPRSKNASICIAGLPQYFNSQTKVLSTSYPVIQAMDQQRQVFPTHGSNTQSFLGIALNLI